MTTDTLPTTTTERLHAVADHLEANPHLWVQSDWVRGCTSPEDAAGRGACGTPGCIAGEGVMFTPPELLAEVADWSEAGAIAYGLADDLADAIFAGGYKPADLPAVLRTIAGIREGNRTARAFVQALTGADLHGANLTRANLAGADLYRANLYGADLAGANLTRARGDHRTRLPAGWKVGDDGMVVADGGTSDE